MFSSAFRLLHSTLQGLLIYVDCSVHFSLDCNVIIHGSVCAHPRAFGT